VSFFGRILDIDLGKGDWALRACPPDLANSVVGGRGLNVGYLYQHLPRGIDPLGPDNIITFACGFLTGTAAPASSRLHINALSPLTGLLGSSNVGGRFGNAMRSCGIQQVIVRGCSADPVYLYVDEDTIELRKAKSLWGLTTDAAADRLRSRLASKRVEILTIGPAAENGVLFSCIMAGRHHAAGRTGMGTVMGAKRLKAIVVKERKSARPFRKNGENEAIRRYAFQITHSPQYELVSELGGAGYINWADEQGIMPTRNYRDCHFEAADRLDGQNLVENVVRRRGCRRCPVNCKADLRIERGNLKGRDLNRPEFESIMTLGAKCGLSDLDAVIHLDNLCSRLGLDILSAAGVIAFAMDLFDRGILDRKATGGIDLTWGNPGAMETLIRQMVDGKGFGAVLRNGIQLAAEMIGGGAGKYAAHVKGLEMTGYHPDNMMGTALGYTVASRGADYNDVYASLENKWLPDRAVAEFGTPHAVDTKSIHGKAALVRRAMIVGVALDSLGICKVPALSLICAYDLVGEAELAAALSGEPVTAGQLVKAGERIVNIERLFNLRHGASASDDRLPDMFFDPDYNAGNPPSKPHEWMEPMIREFYALMGWDDQGRPSPDKLKELGIHPGDTHLKPAA
jgi:aldehyde:ferredoxin oxidoreductase